MKKMLSQSKVPRLHAARDVSLAWRRAAGVLKVGVGWGGGEN